MRNRLILCSFLLATVGVAVIGCDITRDVTRYTTDTLSRFTATTSPGSAFTADGLLKEEQKALFFIAVNADNLRRDISQGHGEYLTSLSRLLDIPTERQKEFFLLAQSRYPSLYASKDETPEDMLAALTGLWNQHESGKTYIPVIGMVRAADDLPQR
jgi:hypothetical protein